jgi:hypothetical protein
VDIATRLKGGAAVLAKVDEPSLICSSSGLNKTIS